MSSLLSRLVSWRDDRARRDGVPSYRVLPFATLRAISLLQPKNDLELLQVPGIKSARLARYGREILSIVCGEEGSLEDNNQKIVPHGSHDDFVEGLYSVDESSGDLRPALSVGVFLDAVNAQLSFLGSVRVQGEVTSVDERERVVYFSLKDSESDAVVSCLIFRSHYSVSSVVLVVGQDVIVDGSVEVYKPTGRLGVRAQLLEDVGEGGLLRAYEKLKEKMAKEGLFSFERKRPLPQLPKRIALITSSHGAAIGDFSINLARCGFHILFFPVSVEGKRAVFDLLDAFKRVSVRADVDVVVLVRGGGSLESLQAFNNEALARAIVDCPFPVVCGVGHEKDETIATLVADLGVSTPTAAAQTVSRDWLSLRESFFAISAGFVSSGGSYFSYARRFFDGLSFSLSGHCGEFLSFCRERMRVFAFVIDRLDGYFAVLRERLLQNRQFVFDSLARFLRLRSDWLCFSDSLISSNNPRNIIRRGYAIVRNGKKVVRSVKDVEKDDILLVELCDGIISSHVDKKKTF
ncbi:MAG: exodeoxyribonuclease VII large subunit [Candidatus Moranbacteria bacterium]|nr:exodeoxyribonuclease VII large subunit [Candidatus Moranbacteria bacterium]